jgi:hypothetical protein
MLDDETRIFYLLRGYQSIVRLASSDDQFRGLRWSQMDAFSVVGVQDFEDVADEDRGNRQKWSLAKVCADSKI